MTTRSPSQVRRDFAERIGAMSGWTVSPEPYSQHDVGAVPNSQPATTAHLSFSVGIPESVPSDGTVFGGRQKPATGVYAQSEVRVRFFARHMPRDEGASEDVALDAESALVVQIMSSGWPTTALQIVWIGSERELVETGEWFVVEARFQVRHRIALS